MNNGSKAWSEEATYWRQNSKEEEERREEEKDGWRWPFVSSQIHEIPYRKEKKIGKPEIEKNGRKAEKKKSDKRGKKEKTVKKNSRASKFGQWRKKEKKQEEKHEIETLYRLGPKSEFWPNFRQPSPIQNCFKYGHESGDFSWSPTLQRSIALSNSYEQIRNELCKISNKIDLLSFIKKEPEEDFDIKNLTDDFSQFSLSSFGAAEEDEKKREEEEKNEEEEEEEEEEEVEEAQKM